MASYFVKQGQYIRLESKEATIQFDTLPVGTYVVQFNPMAGFYLEPVETAALPTKIYGNHQKDADRILNTFLNRPRSTGVLLSGEKGSGKTMLTRLISHDAAKQSIPTLLVNAPYHGDAFNNFMSEISQPCVVLFDEFEKVYDKESQASLLTLMDGLVKSQKLYILTTNDRFSVSFFMRNRPGRLYYMLEYVGLSAEFIREYSLDKLNNLSQVDGVVSISNLFRDFNFDMLQALIEEMNRYDETASDALRLLNIKPDNEKNNEYDVELVDPDGNKLETSDTSITQNPLLYRISFTIGVGPKDEYNDYKDYVTPVFKPEDIIGINSKDGTIRMLNAEGFVLKLSKVKDKAFDIGHAYRLAEAL